MISRLRVPAALLLLVCGLAFAAPGSTGSREPGLVLRVLSATPGQESDVEGVLAYRAAGPTYLRVKGTTPLEIAVPGAESLDGILTALGDGVRIGLDVRSDSSGDERAFRWQSGHIVVFHLDSHPAWRGSAKGM